MFSFFQCLCAVALLPQLAMAMYGASSAVKSVGASDFKDEVMKHAGIVIVEFYAPWCGHCKSLEPEYEKAASVLGGVVKVVAVDATQHESLAQKYGIQGFPTIKVFGADKRKPVDYQGQRTADGIISEAMKAANQLVKDRKSGKASGSTNDSGAKKERAAPSGGSKGSGSGSGSGSKGSDVVQLTEANFNALVMDSNDHWLIEFYAPWCGHCKALAPEWETAATQLKGSVKLGAVDATVHGSLAQQYGVKGYPTLKLFPAGKKNKEPEDYRGKREAPEIVAYALQTLDAAGVPPSIHEITSSSVFSDTCSASGRVCAIMFVPHILDSGAAGRNAYLDTLGEVAKSNRGKPINYAWVEAGAQPALEEALQINQAYPGLAVLSAEKKVFGVQRVSWSLKNIKAFLGGVLSGTERTSALPALPKIVKSKAWDGKDAVLASDEIPLDELFSE